MHHHVGTVEECNPKATKRVPSVPAPSSSDLELFSTHPPSFPFVGWPPFAPAHRSSAGQHRVSSTKTWEGRFHLSGFPIFFRIIRREEYARSIILLFFWISAQCPTGPVFLYPMMSYPLLSLRFLNNFIRNFRTVPKYLGSLRRSSPLCNSTVA